MCGLQSSNCALFKGNEQLQCVHKASVKPTWFGRVAEPLKKKKKSSLEECYHDSVSDLQAHT